MKKINERRERDATLSEDDKRRERINGEVKGTEKGEEDILPTL